MATSKRLVGFSALLVLSLAVSAGFVRADEHEPASSTAAPAAAAAPSTAAPTASAAAASTTKTPEATGASKGELAASLGVANVTTTTAKPVAATAAAAVANTTAAIASAVAGKVDKFAQYLVPVCDEIDKIVPKQAFKIQSQIKQIIEKTNNKLSFCFLEHYGINPTMTPVSKANVVSICHSRGLAAGKGSYKSFRACADENWDAGADKTLDLIMSARLSHEQAHNHSQEEMGAPSLLHGDDDMSLIGDVVSKILDDGRAGSGPPADIRYIDASAPSSSSPVAAAAAAATSAATTTAKPATSGASTSSPSSTAAPSVTVAPTAAASVAASAGAAVANATVAGEKKSSLLNDPNTVLVLVDLPANGTTKTTAAPAAGLVDAVAKGPKAVVEAAVATLASTTVAPEVVVSVTSAAPTATVVVESTAAPAEAAAAATTGAPTTAEPAKAAATVSGNATLVATASEPSSSTAAPVVVATEAATTTEAPAAAAEATTTAKPGETEAGESTTTAAPSAGGKGSLKDLLKKPVKEGVEKVKEGVEKAKEVGEKLGKKLEEVSPIKGLAGSSRHDSHMHALEHERQMAIDPVGHTIKHQQYELRKQQKLDRFAG